ncbi:MAG: SDR family NAD(P)-dependent oxidoreductase [Candidatus Binataceae bacterium]
MASAFSNPTKMFDLRGQVAVITGGNRGIGRAIALALAQAGASIAIMARDERMNREAIAEITECGVPALALPVDLTRRAQLEPALREAERSLGGLDILVNNAAMAVLKGILEQSAEEWDRVLETNLNACFLLTKYAAQSMITRKRGKIINVSSIAGHFGTPVFPSYSVAKGGLQQLTKCCALELAPYNIQVNSLMPGWFDTDMTDWIRNWPEYAEAHKEMIQRTPRGRFGEPAELAGAVTFLASSASDHMTGAELVIDGGFSVR